jgi:hypothetical protein
LIEFPDWTDAPATLRHLDGHCGPLAAWAVLRHFRVRASAAAIIGAVRHSPRGAFTIGIAVALAEMGLRVTFYSDPDPDVQPSERPLYGRAQRLGVVIEPAIGVQSLASAVRDGGIPVVFYRQRGGGHFSPMLGVERGHVLLPYGLDEKISLTTFRRAWKQPGFCRQALIVRRPPNTALQPTSRKTRRQESTRAKPARG